MEQPVEDGAGGVNLGGGRVRVLHLPENLRLADNQRVEAGRDPEQVPRRLEIQAVVEMRLHHRSIDRVEL